MPVSHDNLIEALRRFADELEARPPQNRPVEYQIGGYQMRRFFHLGIEVRAEVIEPVPGFSLPD